MAPSGAPWEVLAGVAGAHKSLQPVRFEQHGLLRGTLGGHRKCDLMGPCVQFGVRSVAFSGVLWEVLAGVVEAHKSLPPV